MTNLTALSFLENPLTTFVISETQASANLSVNLSTISGLRTQGISVFTYPLALQLTSPRMTAGAFSFNSLDRPVFTPCWPQPILSTGTPLVR